MPIVTVETLCNRSIHGTEDTSNYVVVWKLGGA
jgi:hypothetical protein